MTTVSVLFTPHGVRMTTADEHKCWKNDVFLRFRTILGSNGATFDNAIAGSDDSNSDSDDSDEPTGSDESAVDANTPDGVVNRMKRTSAFANIQKLGWCLRSDNVLTRDTVLDRISDMSNRDKRRLYDNMTALEYVLSLDPHVGAKKGDHRLQFVALGEVWYETVRGDPTIADFLETEMQNIDLAAILNDMMASIN